MAGGRVEAAVDSANWMAAVQCYAHFMRMPSVADELKKRERAEVSALSFPERVALVLSLGERELERFRRARGLERRDAMRLLQRRRQAGRIPCKCIEDLIG